MASHTLVVVFSIDAEFESWANAFMHAFLIAVVGQKQRW
jgi:hypothetical protein